MGVSTGKQPGSGALSSDLASGVSNKPVGVAVVSSPCAGQAVTAPSPESVCLNLKHGKSGDSGVLGHCMGKAILSALLLVMTKLQTEATQGRKGFFRLTV